MSLRGYYALAVFFGEPSKSIDPTEQFRLVCDQHSATIIFVKRSR